MNAKEELISHVGSKEILCALITMDREYWEDELVRTMPLKKNYTPTEMYTFLKSLDFVYDSGYGGQQLFGNIWYTDGTWSERGEYDGLEWWEHKSCPKIPKNLK